MAYGQVKGLQQLAQLNGQLARLEKHWHKATKDIFEGAKDKGVEIAIKNAPVGASGDLKASIRGSVGKRKDGYTVRILAGKGRGTLRPEANQDPGAYYAYYQEFGFRQHYIYRPWIWSRSPVTRTEGGATLRRGEKKLAVVGPQAGRYYMRSGFRAASTYIRTHISDLISFEEARK